MNEANKSNAANIGKTNQNETCENYNGASKANENSMKVLLGLFDDILK